jgi:hypothetical protein
MNEALRQSYVLSAEIEAKAKHKKVTVCPDCGWVNVRLTFTLGEVCTKCAAPISFVDGRRPYSCGHSYYR